MSDIQIIDKNRELYEQYSEFIDREVSKRKLKWHLTAVNYIDFDDVSQIIKTHILKKIHLYQAEKSAFVNWLNTLISNQMINLLRNHYGSFSKCCNKCNAAEGEDGCRIYGKQCNTCPVFHNWGLSKKNAYDIRLPLPTENHSNEVSSMPDDSVDIEKSISGFHKIMLSRLEGVENKVYRMSYVELKTDALIASVILCKPITSITKKDIKSIENTKCRIAVKARDVVYSGDVDIIGDYT